MTTQPDNALLAQYVQENSEEAFRTLMFRYANLVYGVCNRTLHNTELAEDATQSVFLLLAKNAKKLRVRPTIVGWLHTTSVNVSRTLARKEGTRKVYEKMATPMIQNPEDTSHPLKHFLDAAVAELKGEEREAILLRFFQDTSYQELGRLQSVSEDAARMRVNRALEHLRQNLTRAGLALSPVELGSLLPKTAENAPVSLFQKLGAMPILGRPAPLKLTKGISKTIMISSPIIVSLVVLVTFSGTGAHAPKIAMRSGPAASSVSQPKASRPVQNTGSDKERKVDAKESLNALISEFPGNWDWITYTDDKAHPLSKDTATVSYNPDKQVFEIRGKDSFTDWKPDPDKGTIQRFAVYTEPVYEQFVSGTEKQGRYSLVFAATSAIAKYQSTIKFDKDHFEFFTKTTELHGSPAVVVTVTFERPGP